MKIGNRNIGAGEPCYLVAELSANHGQNFDQAVALIRAMHEAGADAVKVQTYTADSLTIDCRREPFVVRGGTLWDGRTLHDLYQEAAMPWEWQPKLQALALDLGMDFFSTPFDFAAVDFLEDLHVPTHKIASFELIDLPLLRRVAATRKPVIMSTGMATIDEIEEALATLRAAGAGPVALLKCTSAYPAPVNDMHLRTIPDMARRFGVPIGLSDHTPGHTAAVVAVALGACIIEKHFTLSRALPGPDSAFSMEPQEFQAMVVAIRQAEQALGKVNYTVSAKEEASRALRRSLFVVRDVRAGDVLTAENVRCIRPGHGLHPRHLDEVLGSRAAQDLAAGTPLAWPLLVRAATPGT